MKGLVLAAGEGTRLRPLTADRPKPMVSVAGVPMIAYALDWMRTNGVTEVAINTHYRPEPLGRVRRRRRGLRSLGPLLA